MLRDQKLLRRTHDHEGVRLRDRSRPVNRRYPPLIWNRSTP